MAPLTLLSTIKLNTGYNMPLLGFGVYQNYTATPSCLEAFKAGYRHVDSARAYRNEDAVGAAVRDSGIPRKDLFITSKIVSKDHGYESTIRCVDESLARFGFDYLDLYLIHNPHSGKSKRLETYSALLDCQKAGKLRSVGVSNYGVKHLEEIREADFAMPSVNQIELHPFCQQKPIVEYCNVHNIVVQAYCPLVRAGKEVATSDVIASIADKHSRDLAQVLLRWSLQKGYVPLPKSATPARIHSNANLYDFELDEEDMTVLDSLDKGSAGAVSWNPVDVE